MSAEQGVMMARRLAGAMLVVAATAAPVMAQNAGASGGRWSAWIGCWSASPADGVSPLTGESAPLVCITPTSDANVVQLATISRDSVISTQRLDASGRPQPLEAKGCTGTQRAHWSADERRVYLESAAVCEGVKRVATGILSFTPSGEWLDVQSLSAGDGEQMRVVRYHDAGVPRSVPAEIASAITGRSMASQSARLAAGADIGSSAVREAVSSASVGVVEAWLLERGQRFSLDAHELVALADAGVPARVTDAMIAVSNPKEFAIAHGQAELQREERDLNAERDQQITGRRVYVTMLPWAWGYDPYYGYGYYGYGYGRPAYYGYGYPYGYNGGYGYPAYGVGAPIVVVRGSQGETRGKLVKGRGYTPASTTTQPTPTRAPASSSSSSPSGSGAASSGSSSSGSSSSGRTAHEKP